MGLRIQKRWADRYKNLIFAGLSVFAFVVQPFYGVVASQVANALSSTITTTPAVSDTTTCAAPVPSVVNVNAADDAGTYVIGKVSQDLSNPALAGIQWKNTASGTNWHDFSFTNNVATYAPTGLGGWQLASSNDTSVQMTYPVAGTYKTTIQFVKASDGTTPVGTPFSSTVTVSDCAVKNTRTGVSYNTINEGLSAALAGDTLQIAAGTYNEHLNITKNIHLVGAGNDQTIIKSTAIGNVVEILGVSGSGGDTISNLTIDGNGYKSHGMNIYNSNGISLWRVKAVNNGKSGINVVSSRVVATDITTSGNKWHGLDVDQTGDHSLPKSWVKIAGQNDFGDTGLDDHGIVISPLYFDHWSADQLEIGNDQLNTLVAVDHYASPSADDRAYFPVSVKPAKPELSVRQNGTILANSITNHTGDNLKLDWTPVSPATGYGWSWTAPDGTSGNDIGLLSIDVNNPFVPLTNLVNAHGEGVYTFKVYAFNKINLSKISSGYSDTVQFTYDKSKPTTTGNFTGGTTNNGTLYNPTKFTINGSDNGSGIKGTVGHIYKWNSTTTQYELVLGGGLKLVNPLNLVLNGYSAGKYQIKYNVTDNAGNVSSTHSAYFTLDTEKPLAPTNLQWLANGTNVSNGLWTNVYDGVAKWDASTSPDTDHYVYRYWNDIVGNQYKVGTEWPNSNGTFVGALTLGGVFNQGNGMHHFAVAAVDHAGNVSDWSDYAVGYDAGPLAAPVLSNDNNGKHFKTKPIVSKWSPVTGSASGVDHYEVAYAYDDNQGSGHHVFETALCNNEVIDGLKVSGCRADVGTGTQRSHVPGENEQGGVTVWVRAYDKAGNVSPWSDSIHYIYDSVNPDKPTLTFPDNGVVVKGASITQSWSDTSSDVDHYIYESYNDAGATSHRWGGGVNGEGVFPASQTSKTATNVGNATYWWRVKAVDHAGNVSDWSDLRMITVDNDAPVVTLDQTLNGKTLQGPVDVSGTVTDSHPHHYWVQVKKNGSVVSSETGTTNDSNNFSGVLRTLNGDGVYEVTLAARDAAGGTATSGNRSGDVAITFTIDNTGPAITGDETGVISGAGTIAPALTDEDGAQSGNTYKWVQTSGPSATISGNGTELNPTFTPNVDGDYVFTLTATDPQGNVTVKAFSFIYAAPVQAQAVAPATTTPGTGPAAAAGNGFTNVNITDGDSGVLGDSTTNTDTNKQGSVDDKGASTQQGSVKGASDEHTGCTQFLGICWYYWIPVVIIVLAVLEFTRRKLKSNSANA